MESHCQSLQFVATVHLPIQFQTPCVSHISEHPEMLLNFLSSISSEMDLSKVNDYLFSKDFIYLLFLSFLIIDVVVGTGEEEDHPNCC